MWLQMSPSPANKHFFYMEMAKLLGAGFDIRKAAAVMGGTPLPKGQKLLLRDLNEGLDAGETIADAFSRDSRAVGVLERGMIAAGERGGKLAPAFQHLADYFGMVAAVRRELIMGMIYPMIILHLGVFIGTIPLSLMGPPRSIGEIASDFAQSLLILYASIAIVLLLGKLVLAKAPVNALLDRSINRIPWIGKARGNMAMARFCKVYHACLLAGVSMVETVRVSAHAASSGMIRRAGDRLAAIVKEGNPLGPGFMKESAFPSVFSRSYAVGEEAGTLDTDMANWSAKFQEDATSSAKLASTMVPKVLYFLILAYVAVKIIGFFSGYYTELDQIGD